MTTAYHRYKPLTVQQLRFIRRLERGDSTAEQVIDELKITGTMFGYWLQKPTFVKRYQRVLQQLKAKAASAEATAHLHHARKKMNDQSAPARPSEPPILDNSALSQRLLELHGSEDAVAKMTDDIKIKNQR